MGGTHSPLCNAVAKSIWLWAISRRIWLSCSYLPGKKIKTLSRNSTSDHMERMLNPDIYRSTSKKLEKPETDLFASKLNEHLEKYVFWKPQKEEFAIDAVTINLKELCFYVFLLFGLTSRVLQKIRSDCANLAIIIVPESLRHQGTCGKSTEVIFSSWQSSTQKQYKCFHKKWIFYCSKRKTGVFRPSVVDVIAFLTELSNGTSYSGLNSVRCELSAIVLQAYTIGKHPVVSRFIKCYFELRLTSCRYSQMWDVSRVLNFLRTHQPLHSLSLKSLSLKLVMLVALVSSHRLLRYLEVTSTLRGQSTKLFISCVKP
ncbi:hypothetical protein HOLleu_43358 [Holothuria leucospilota]|uniref:Uncharacterized protein n=1 Tax=Holothuria leucospilota TaxID=206669 RepID=A0A9Q1BB44_HOLLE|nr:hypothetical protein HOLleu_43358 [Holothuria leucospilota]